MKLAVDNIWVKLSGVDILRDVSLEVGEGINAVLIGRNGAGKTTTFRTIMSIIKPWKGRIYAKTNNKNYEINRLKPYQVAGLGISYVPQGRMIFPDLTVEENLDVVKGTKLSDDILEWIYSIMPELKKIKNRLGIYLSGGESQMLAVARALAREPKIILLDEPLEGLAPKVISKLIETLENIEKTGVAILITESGNLKRVRELVDIAYGIDRGEIVYSGNVDGIFEDKIARKRIWGI